ncbi:peptidylprolyl isomerase [bacterium]|nr:peptidylprolyl isomerase [bacterium]MBQ4438631.1 peptidylprolyl isomerase [bacterium]
MKKGLVLFFTFILFSSVFAGEQLLNKMVVRVNGKVYTIYDCKKLLRFDDPASVQTQAVLERKDKLIDQLINNAISKQEAEALDIKVPDDELDAAVDSVLTQNRMTREQFEQELSKSNMSFETYRNEVLREQLLLLKLKKRIIVTMDVDERALREIYEKEFSSEPELYFTASHIILQANESNDAEIKDAVTAIYKEVTEGKTTFAEAAKSYSQDGSAANGGALGTFSARDMVPEFSERLAEMKEGEVSEPFRTRYGWHIVKLDKVEKHDPPTYNESYEMLRNIYYQRNVEKMFQTWLKKKRSESKIDILL